MVFAADRGVDLIQSHGFSSLDYGCLGPRASPNGCPAPCAPIGTSNSFELARAVAIGLFSLSLGAALVTVVGVLIEVQVMLSLVIVLRNHLCGGYLTCEIGREGRTSREFYTITEKGRERLAATRVRLRELKGKDGME